MLLLLARHGNTFHSHEKPTYVGTEDLALTQDGKRQAEELRDCLDKCGIELKACFTSQLQRTKVFGEIAVSKAKIPLSLREDSRLNEIDYGSWSGKSREEVARLFPEELSSFEGSLVYPDTFSPRPEQIRVEIVSFLKDLLKSHESPVLVVSSQAKLRYFQELDPLAWEKAVAEKKFKMAPGHLSAMVYQERSFRVLFWNQKPVEVSERRLLDSYLRMSHMGFAQDLDS